MKTRDRMRRLFPTLDSLEQDSLRDTINRMTRSMMGSWENMSRKERSESVSTMLAELNRKMDAMERGRELLAEQSADTPRRPMTNPSETSTPPSSKMPTGGSSDGITRDQAIAIANHLRRSNPDLPERCTSAVRVTEEAPGGLYRVWDDEPAWYVWFLTNTCGLASSFVLVVSKRTGEVIGGGSAGDEG
jgi:hypothetical protein